MEIAKRTTAGCGHPALRITNVYPPISSEAQLRLCNQRSGSLTFAQLPGGTHNAFNCLTVSCTPCKSKLASYTNTIFCNPTREWRGGSPLHFRRKWGLWEEGDSANLPSLLPHLRSKCAGQPPRGNQNRQFKPNNPAVKQSKQLTERNQTSPLSSRKAKVRGGLTKSCPAADGTPCRNTPAPVRGSPHSCPHCSIPE